jgi:hypothetical protein
MSPEEITLKVQDIDTAITDLATLSAKTGAPASLQHQYVGTIVDNTLVLLTGVANALDGGKRSVSVSEYDNWLSTLKAVHRSFYNTIINAIELGMDKVRQQDSLTIKTQRARTAESLISAIEKSNGPLSPRLRSRIRQLSGNHPDFMDYIETVITHRLPNEGQRDVWRNSFKALVIVRNKASHSKPTLSSAEVLQLQKGGMGALVSPEGELISHVDYYQQIIESVLRFLDEIGLGE